MVKEVFKIEQDELDLLSEDIRKKNLIIRKIDGIVKNKCILVL